MVDQTSQTSGGVGFLGLLTITFIALKVCGVISWSWWWVLAPLWIVALLILGILSVIGVVILVEKRRVASRRR